jgi:hypothetical protein
MKPLIFVDFLNLKIRTIRVTHSLNNLWFFLLQTSKDMLFLFGSLINSCRRDWNIRNILTNFNYFSNVMKSLILGSNPVSLVSIKNYLCLDQINVLKNLDWNTLKVIFKVLSRLCIPRIKQDELTDIVFITSFVAEVPTEKMMGRIFEGDFNRFGWLSKHWT